LICGLPHCTSRKASNAIINTINRQPKFKAFFVKMLFLRMVFFFAFLYFFFPALFLFLGFLAGIFYGAPLSFPCFAIVFFPVLSEFFFIFLIVFFLVFPFLFLFFLIAFVAHFRDLIFLWEIWG